MRAGGLIYQPILLALGHDDQPLHVEGCNYHQPLQKSGRVPYQPLRAPLANADGGCSTLKEGTKEQDVSPLMNDVDGGLYGNKEKSSVDGGHHVLYQLLMPGSPSGSCEQEDVSPPTGSDEGQHGAHHCLLIGRTSGSSVGQHGAKEEGEE